jgi:hypothetical protein
MANQRFKPTLTPPLRYGVRIKGARVELKVFLSGIFAI